VEGERDGWCPFLEGCSFDLSHVDGQRAFGLPEVEVATEDGGDVEGVVGAEYGLAGAQVFGTEALVTAVSYPLYGTLIACSCIGIGQHWVVKAYLLIQGERLILWQEKYIPVSLGVLSWA